MKITNIMWDTDGISIDDLPEQLLIPDEVFAEDIRDEDGIADWLSDCYGWCVESFVIERE